MPTENKIDCPALHQRSDSYPFGDRVPRTVRMLKTVTADPMPGIGLAYIKGDAPVAKEGQTYSVWTNSHGAVTAVMGGGVRLGLRPAEFEVDSWHNIATEPAPQPHPEPIAWMVGTAFWWTKEEAERDASATGLSITPVGPITESGKPAEQHQGEPLPITNDMQRLMEACRIGEFKDEGGSETVEALAVASLDAKSSMGHDADSYMAGYSAALFEQAEPFIWLSLNSQRQREPAAWMDPRSPQMHATISNEVKRHNLKFGGAPASAVNGYTIPLYTHADPGEAERLKREIDHLKGGGQLLVQDRNELRTLQAETRKLLAWLCNDVDSGLTSNWHAKLQNHLDGLPQA